MNAKAKPTASPNEQYQATADEVWADCELIDPCWLADNRPDLWLKLRDLDERAGQLERRGETGEPYQNVMDDIIATVRKARRLYESRPQGRAA